MSTKFSQKGATSDRDDEIDQVEKEDKAYNLMLEKERERGAKKRAKKRKTKHRDGTSTIKETGDRKGDKKDPSDHDKGGTSGKGSVKVVHKPTLKYGYI